MEVSQQFLRWFEGKTQDRGPDTLKATWRRWKLTGFGLIQHPTEGTSSLIRWYRIGTDRYVTFFPVATLCVGPPSRWKPVKWLLPAKTNALVGLAGEAAGTVRVRSGMANRQRFSTYKRHRALGYTLV